MTTRADLVYKAQIAEAGERYEDMAAFMKETAEYGVSLNIDERNLLSVAYKNVVGILRSGFRTLQGIEDSTANSSPYQMSEISNYKAEIVEKLSALCTEIQNLIDDTLLKNEETVEGKVFYHKMAGDYCRYLAELESGDARGQAADSAKSAYEKASDLAQELAATHPIRLGLALNFSVFYYEILSQSGLAVNMAQNAFDSASAEIDDLDCESRYKDATAIMSLLTDNLALWKEDEEATGKMGDNMEVEDL